MSKMASSLNEASLEKKFNGVTNTQESIQTLSLWCIHHRAHHRKIVDVWMKVMKKAKPTHRLALLYLANDVIQNSKRKSNSSFADSWGTVLKDMVPLMRDEKILNQVERILNIWEQRNVYDSDFIENLRNGLKVDVSANAKSRPTIDAKLLADFKLQKVVDKIKKTKKVEADSELKRSQLMSMNIDVSSTETLRQLKDRAHGDKFSKEFEDATATLGEYVQTLEKEVQERTALLEILEKADKFYDNQRGDAKIVANAYKNFGSRVKNLKKKLTEMKNALPSPVPSPTPDAPSPVDSDVEMTIPDVTKDNTEAVDMEMSDEEMGGTLKLEDPDMASLGSAPSPDGSPVGLNIPSPPPRTNKKDEKRLKSELRPNAMTSLIDSMSGAMSSRKGSLESRLSNLMQNMTNFSPAIDSSLFDEHPATPPSRLNSSRLVSPANDGSATPLKDEGSATGSTTPLQDEELEASKASLSCRPNSWQRVDPTPSQIDSKLSVSDVIKQIGYQANSMKTSCWNSKPIEQSYSPNSWFNSSSQPSSIVQNTTTPIEEQNNPQYNYAMNFTAPPIDEQDETKSNDVYNQSQPPYGYAPNTNYDSLVSPNLCRPPPHKRNPNIVELTPSPTRSAVTFEENRSHSNLITVVQNNNSNNQDRIRFTLKGKSTPITPNRAFGANNVRLIPSPADNGNENDQVNNVFETIESENGDEAEVNEETVSRIETVGMRRNFNDNDLYSRRDEAFTMISPPAPPRPFSWQSSAPPPFDNTNSFYPQQQQQQQQRFNYGPPPKRFARPRFESRRPPYPPRF